MRKAALLPLASALALVIAVTGCFEDPAASSGDGDGDGDETTAGDGDGDPSTGDGDGDPTTGDGDGDPTTGDGDGDPNCDDEVVVYDMFQKACDDGQWWTYDGVADSHPIVCGSEPPGANLDGWGRPLDPAMNVEGSLLIPKALEIGAWGMLDATATGVDFNQLTMDELCQPRLKVEVACGFVADGPCELEYRVQIKDHALPFDAPPLTEVVGVETADGSATPIEIDLAPYQDKVVNVTLMLTNQQFAPGDVLIYGWPRVVANQ